jgi:hypothetical protein
MACAEAAKAKTNAIALNLIIASLLFQIGQKSKVPATSAACIDARLGWGEFDLDQRVRVPWSCETQGLVRKAAARSVESL